MLKKKDKILTFKPNWEWDRNTEEWLKSICIGYTLNFPCGNSYIGDVRADIDPNVKPDVIANLKDPFKTFKKLQFDTVVCDPPFEYYNKLGWVHNLSKLARKRLILFTPAIPIFLNKSVWKKSYYILESRKGRIGFMRIVQVFDRMALLEIDQG
jgi:hypothetical protein